MLRAEAYWSGAAARADPAGHPGSGAQVPHRPRRLSDSPFRTGGPRAEQRADGDRWAGCGMRSPARCWTGWVSPDRPGNAGVAAAVVVCVGVAVLPAVACRRPSRHPVRCRPDHGDRPGGVLLHADSPGAGPRPPYPPARYRDGGPGGPGGPGGSGRDAAHPRLRPIFRVQQAEAAGLQQRFPGRVSCWPGPRPPTKAVLAALPAARWAHFACHGSSDLANPSASYLLLDDHSSRR